MKGPLARAINILRLKYVNVYINPYKIIRNQRTDSFTPLSFMINPSLASVLSFPPFRHTSKAATRANLVGTYDTRTLYRISATLHCAVLPHINLPAY